MKDGRPLHDGDCKFWDMNICTCGLIHHVSWFDPETVGEWFWKERGRHDWALQRLGPPGIGACGYVSCDECRELRQKEADEMLKRFQKRNARHPLLAEEPTK